jgi:large repetitive protein
MLLTFPVCPADVTIFATLGSCGAPVLFDIPEFSDNCNCTTLAQLPGILNGSVQQVGSYTVGFSASDAALRSESCSFTVTVVDNEAPTLICPASLALSTEPGSCARNVSFGSLQAFDNCNQTSVIPVSGQANGSSFQPGLHEISFAVMDAALKIASCAFFVNVSDTEAPMLCKFLVSQFGCVVSLVFLMIQCSCSSLTLDGFVVLVVVV